MDTQSPTRDDYDQAIRNWAYAIVHETGTEGILMGATVTIADIIGVGMDEVGRDIEAAKRAMA